MKLCHLFFLFFLTTSLWSQSKNLTQKDSTLRVEWMKNTGNHAALFAGKEQMKYPISMENHPFFIQQEPFKSFLRYDGVDYPVVDIKWDTYKDEVIVVTEDKRYNVVLIPERFVEAHFENYHLLYLNSKDFEKAPQSGYYLNLYDNELRVLERRTAALNEKPHNQRMIGYFTFVRRFYIQKGSVFYAVKNRASVLKVLKDKKKELKQFSKENKLDFSSNPEIAIPALVKEYERLTQIEVR